MTFEPVPATIDAPFEVVFARQPDEDADDEIDVDPNIDDPEPLESDELDVGEIVAQELSLALDPYPARRRPTVRCPTSRRRKTPPDHSPHLAACVSIDLRACPPIVGRPRRSIR